ncbi:dehalogenase [Dehalococcoides mccartyi]|jgi:Fe-S-cluster containining protein|uniref:YkgJ family cysteine cluster protein n=1 Tax=Dehalococcoides mccartyi TaxID=61435 RepID=UPI0004E08E47|nr:YkgJ family cysteine cluster protein [Dehalococcoides mccartyi]AII57475.1 reductive dehalogenase associated protein [Dehalococcoides mccartyi CG1]APH11972.1 dehalogenase [Dehalococcoides mccartyi]
MDTLKPFAQSFTPTEISSYKLLTADYDNYCQDQMSTHCMAVKFNFKTCQRCGYCCLCYPCIPRPDEIKPASLYLKITVSELINEFMVVDTADCCTFFLRWAKEGQEDITGARIPPWRIYDRGYCILFDKVTQGCRIYPVRPLEARTIKCWDSNARKDKKLWGMNAWGQGDIYKFLPDFNPKYFRKSRVNLSLPHLRL